MTDPTPIKFCEQDGCLRKVFSPYIYCDEHQDKSSTPTPQNEPWRKDFQPCNVCDKQAVGCLSPDMDIKGLCFCAEHKDEVARVYMIISSDQPNLIKTLMKYWKHK